MEEEDDSAAASSPPSEQHHPPYKKRYYYRSRQHHLPHPGGTGNKSAQRRFGGAGGGKYQQRYNNQHHHHNNRPIVCSNCNGKGHFFKDCKKPIQSYGVLAWTLRAVNGANAAPGDFPPIESSDFIHRMRQLYASGEYKLMVCLIRRRHTIGFEAFVRGKYNDVDELITHRDRMTVAERSMIEHLDWEHLYTQVMAEKDLRYMQREKRRAKVMYDEIDIPAFVASAVTNYEQPSWEFPKGRRFAHERDQDCALREFEEETNVPVADVLIVPASPNAYLREEFCGTNKKMYRNKYYVGIVHPETDGPFLDQANSSQTSEVGAVQWFDYEEAMGVMRPFFQEKKRVLQESHEQIVHMLTNDEPIIGRSGAERRASQASQPLQASQPTRKSKRRRNDESDGCLFFDSEESDDDELPVNEMPLGGVAF